MEIINHIIGVTSPDDLAIESSDDIVGNNTCAITPEELAIDYFNTKLLNVDVSVIKSAQISINTASNGNIINRDACSKMLDCKKDEISDIDISAVTNKRNGSIRSNADMLNLRFCATTDAENRTDVSENRENVSSDSCAVTLEKLAIESEIIERINSGRELERNIIDTAQIKISKNISSAVVDDHVTECLNIKNVGVDSCPIVSDQFAVDSEMIESTNSGIFVMADNHRAIDSSNSVVFSPGTIERISVENVSSGEITSGQFLDNGTDIYVFNADICASTTQECGNVCSDMNANICKQFVVDKSNINIFNTDICATTSEEYENDNTNIEIVRANTSVITPDLFAIHAKNMESIIFDTYDITHEQNVRNGSIIDIFNGEISATEEHAIEHSNTENFNPKSCTITPEHFAVEEENMESANPDIYAMAQNQQAFESSSIRIFNSKASTISTEVRAIESSNMEDISPDFCNTTEQLDSTNMKIVNLGMCTIIPEQLEIIDLNSNLEILNPDTCNPTEEFVLDGISDMEIIPTNLKTSEEDSSTRYTQVYLIDYPDLEKIDLQYTQSIDVQEELLKAFSIPSSSNVVSEFLALNEPQASGEYAQNIENQDDLQFEVNPVPGPSTDGSEVTDEIEKEILLDSKDTANEREKVLPNLEVSNIAVEPDLAALNEEVGDTLLKYYQNIEDQLQFSDFADPNSSIDESEFLALSEREDSATLNTEIPIDLADIRMESLIGSKVDKPPEKNTKVSTVPKDKPFLCCVCGYQSSFKRRYTVHMRTHTGEKPFSCQKCDYKCSDTGTLNKHMRTHSKDKQLKCKTCSYTCTEKSNLTKHILRHKGVKPFKCPDCWFTSAQSSDLKSHVLVHKGEKPLTCISCNVLCPDKETLKRHFLMHEKTFSCSECSYSNTRLELLRRHMISHRGGELYTCFYCKRPFITNLQLENHMRTHSTHKPFSCSECRYSCTLKSTLLKHRLTHGAKKYQPTFTLWVSDAVNE